MTAVVYFPFFNMKPSGPTTVLPSITKGSEVTRASNQDILALTCEQAIYKIVVDITFKQPELLTNIIAILGGMHFLMDFISCIGTLMAESGIKEKRLCQFHLDLLKNCYREKIPSYCLSFANAHIGASGPVFLRENPHQSSMQEL